MKAEFKKAETNRRKDQPFWQTPRFFPALLWHYIKITFRKIKRQKSYSFINIAGLSVGMACFLLIFTWIQFELSYDRFHERSDKLFRVAIRSDSPDEAGYHISTPQILSEAMKNNIPEVEQAGIIQRSRDAVFETETESFTEDGFFADENFLKMFNFDMILRSRSEVLTAPNSIVLTDELAEKIFGSEDPIGKTIHFRSRFLSGDLSVTGIIRKPLKNSHLQFQYLVSTASMSADKNLSEWFNTWDTYAFNTYVELKQRRSQGIVEKKIETLMQEVRPQAPKKEGMVYLQPVTDIHLKSQVTGATDSNNRIQIVHLSGAIALLILLIAGINSMNLSTALASTRIKEICMRKVIGARQAQLIKQFLGESYFFTTLAMVLSLLIFYTIFPVFSSFFGSSLTMSEVEKAPLLLSILGTIVFVGAFSGIYTAFVLSAFQPISLLKKHTGAWLKGTKIRNLLVVFQFSAVVVLMIGTIVITKQLSFIKNTNLGFEREHIVILPLNGEKAISQAPVLKSRLLESSKILDVTVSNSNPLRLGSSVGGMKIKHGNGEEIKIDMSMASIDHDFLDVFGIKIADGRNFSRNFHFDTLHKWLQGYAYRSGFGIEIFIMAGLGTLLIALFAVGLHAVKAAWSNPLDSIRYE